jgi:diguanylate cyclase (GGDEF)-like protein
VRGVTDTASALRRALSTPAGRAAAATAVLLLAVLLTGAAVSRLLPLLLAALIALVRYVDDARVLLAPAAAAALLLLIALLFSQPVPAAAGAAALLLFGVLPGLLWRREARRGTLAPPAAEESAVPTGEPHVSLDLYDRSAEQADMELALRSVASRLDARAVVLWTVDGYHGLAWARAASGSRPTGRVRLSGDALGWTWEQDMRLRLERTPRWADPASIVFAERLRRHDEYGELITYAFDERTEPDATSLDEAAVYLRGVLALHEARAGAAAMQRRMLSLAGGLRAIPGTLQLESLTSDLCHTAIGITDATGAAIGTWDGGRGELLAVVGADGGPRVGDGFTAPHSELALAMLAGTMIVRQAGEWSLGRSNIAHDSERWETRPRAMAAMPLRGAAGPVGVLAVWTSRATALDPAGLELLHALSPYAAMHLEHAQSYGSLREAAERDPLTLLRNRRAFDTVFDAERMRHERYRRPVSLLMIDLDHFKSINDSYGHEAGDEVLRKVAGLLTASIRDVDTAARFGGEEFVLLLPETGLDAAVEAAERIRTLVADSAIEWQNRRIHVSVSIGASSCPATAAEPADLIGTADAALYRAKATGRNRTVAATLPQTF